MMAWLHGIDIRFAPELPMGWLWILVLAAAIVFAVAVWRRLPEFALRGVFLLLLAGMLLNLVLRHDERQALPDKVLIIVDDSESQKIGARNDMAEKALAHLQQEISNLGPVVEPVVVRVPQSSDPRAGDSTRLFTALRESLMNVPSDQIGATVLITDGQVHDAPETAVELGPLRRLSPLHVVLTGKKGEYDRKITLVNAPQYGLIGQTAEIELRVDEQGREGGTPVPLTIWQNGQETAQREVTAGEIVRFNLKVEHPGQNVFEFRVPVADGEMSAANNTAPVIINGVRDRLRVLLVSGVPHMGERAWRNLLKSDPGIDLVHFTILRPPTAMDMTPANELSLIVFPVDELFHSKIADFDLIIFDKYQQFNLLQPQYFANIRSHVRKGGAFLLAMGSDRADQAIFQTALGDTLPVSLAADATFSGTFRPVVAAAGKSHPITTDLTRRGAWGDWHTQANVTAARGETLMTGHGDSPLLVVDQVEEGRVGVISSDNLWLWSKGGRNAGPYNDLLRNLLHWLMKEPELEKGYLKAEARGHTITVFQRDDGSGPRAVTMTSPSGNQSDVMLDTPQDGWMSGSVTATETGVYVFSSGERKVFVVVGTARSAEYADILTTEERVSPAVKATNGTVTWYGDDQTLSLRRVDQDARRLGGDGWLGVKNTESYTVTAVKSRPLLDNPFFLLVALAGLLVVWLAESGRYRRR